MDIAVTGRHTTVSDRFRSHIEDKLAKVPTLAPRLQRIDVLVTHEPNPRQAKASERVEITCRVKGPVIRAEACSDDKYAALDLAIDKLLERLRRANDRRRVHRGRHTPESVHDATTRVNGAGEPAALESTAAEGTPENGWGDSPVEVREKVHQSRPMTLADALRDMELVGHDFYLFHDSETDRPSVVYRRRGWSYGVIHLERPEDAPEEVAS